MNAQASLPLAPSWLRQPVATLDGDGDNVRPSAMAPPRRVLEEAGEGGDAGRRAAIAFGTAVHLLLQYLPSVSPDGRPSAGLAFLRARAASFPGVDAERVLSEALGVIAHPPLAALFGPGARAEVAVRGRLPLAAGGFGDVSGTIDRLAVGADEVVLADFKSGPPKPVVPSAYRDQLAIYRRILTPLWPTRPIRTVLVWTRGPLVVNLDPAELESGLAVLGFASVASA